MPAASTPSAPPLCVVAVGDVMLGRTFEDGHGERADGLLGDDVLRLLDGDVVTGNLECLLTSARDRNPLAHATFRTEAAYARPLLQRFDVLTLANNHVFDFFDVGVEDTLRHLEEMGVRAVGIGRSEAEALEPAVLQRKGHDVAVFGLAMAAAEAPGRSAFVVARPGAKAYERIRRARAAGQTVVVHLHAGGGDVAYPPPDVRAVHERLFQAGASLVLGHHPHRPQGWAVRPEGVQFFGLGDFVFDRFEDGRDTALVARVCWEEGAVDADVVLVQRGRDFRVRRSEGDHAAHWQSELALLNRSLADGTSDRRYLEHAAQQADAHLKGLLRDLRAGGVIRFLRRAWRVGPRRIATTLRIFAQRKTPAR